MKQPLEIFPRIFSGDLEDVSDQGEGRGAGGVRVEAYFGELRDEGVEECYCGGGHCGPEDNVEVVHCAERLLGGGEGAEGGRGVVVSTVHQHEELESTLYSRIEGSKTG
jgi:hypothetical protein